MNNFGDTDITRAPFAVATLQQPLGML
jgi:hypothetical protein